MNAFGGARRSADILQPRRANGMYSNATVAAAVKSCKSASPLVMRRRFVGGGGDANLGLGNARASAKLAPSANICTTSTVTRQLGRLEKPTIASAMRAAGNRLVAKKMQEKNSSASAVTATAITRERIARGGGKSTSCDLPHEKRRTGGSNNAKSNAHERKEQQKQKQNVAATGQNAVRSRLWPQPSKAQHRDARASKPKESKHKDKERRSESDNKTTEAAATATVVAKHRLQELGIQTNEAEILNHGLLIGDITFKMPSKWILEQIDRLRSEARQMAGAANPQQQQQQPVARRRVPRKLNEFEERTNTHLSALQEFIDHNAIKKKPPKRNAKFNQSAMLKSMDELLTQNVPRAESITNIKERVKRKGQELLHLFDDVDGKPPI